MRAPMVVTLALIAVSPVPARAQAGAARDTGYVQSEATIPMRDGVRLYVSILRPRNQSGALPIIMERTPYEADANWKHGFPDSEHGELAREGYIFVFQDIRGRYKSEGQFAMSRPLHDPADRTGVDESTDAWDTIEWLIHNVPNINGRVGVRGISYDGWLSVMAAINPHPALKAISPQAPPADLWMGDDFFHNGAFRLSMGLEYSVMMESSNEIVPFDVGTYDMYDWYLRLGPLSNVVARAFPGGRPTWNTFVQHPAYDAYWRDQALPHVLHAAPVPTLTVGGWWDQEDRYGALTTYAALERFDTARVNRLVMGPWFHGGWAGPVGQRIGQLDFGSPTSQSFRQNVESPFFAWYLKDKGPLNVAEATVFETGSNTWRSFDAWPPREMASRQLYLREDGKLSFDPPAAAARSAAAFDSYVSDPAHPVPYRPRPIQPTYYPRGSEWRIWETMDQRFVDGRPDVLTWTSDTLSSDLAIAGDVTAHLFASTSGSDADWVVKLIDVYPPRDSVNERMGGYELMVTLEIFRGRYRTSFEHPQPITPNAVLEYTIGLHQQSYRFRHGHRLMVQVQSTWFPLYDRNPQTFVPNIFEATASDYRPATQRIWRTARYPSHVTIPVIPN